jgi:hypothetical protein
MTPDVNFCARIPMIGHPFKKAREPNPGPLPSASVANDPDINSVNAIKRHCQQASKLL